MSDSGSGEGFPHNRLRDISLRSVYRAEDQAGEITAELEKARLQLLESGKDVKCALQALQPTFEARLNVYLGSFAHIITRISDSDINEPHECEELTTYLTSMNWDALTDQLSLMREPLLSLSTTSRASYDAALDVFADNMNLCRSLSTFSQILIHQPLYGRKEHVVMQSINLTRIWARKYAKSAQR